jgi:uncharacterized membrane protein YuzA (DUF378 family)
MRVLNIVTLLLVIAGGVNWLLVALGGHELDAVANLLGGVDSPLARLAYLLIGLSALYQFRPLIRSFRRGEAAAQAER